MQIESVNKVEVSCFGGADGSIDITVIGGSMPYTYSWTGGTTSSDQDRAFFTNLENLQTLLLAQLTSLNPGEDSTIECRKKSGELQ